MLATTWTKLDAMSTLRSFGTGVGLGEAVGADFITGVGEAVFVSLVLVGVVSFFLSVAGSILTRLVW